MMIKWAELIASKAIIILFVLLFGILALKSLTSFILNNAEKSSDKLKKDQITLEAKLDSIQTIKIKTQAQDSIINTNDSSLRITHLKYKKQIEDEHKSINNLLLHNLITQQKKNEKIIGILDILDICANILIGIAIVIGGIGLLWRK